MRVRKSQTVTKGIQVVDDHCLPVVNVSWSKDSISVELDPSMFKDVLGNTEALDKYMEERITSLIQSRQRLARELEPRDREVAIRQVTGRIMELSHIRKKMRPSSNG